MDFFWNIIKAITLKMPSPTNYGWFHLMFIAIFILLSLGGIFLANHKHSEKTLKAVLLTCGIIMVLFEIYKQVVFTFEINGDGSHSISYKWYAFPFQLCSTPMYIMIIAALWKPGKIRDCLLGYLAMFGLFGGLCVYIFPNDVFGTAILGIDIQTMIHHGLQIAVGIFVFAYYRPSFNFKKWNLWFWLGSFIIFGIQLVIAMTLNLTIVHFIGDQTFNMFYISPYFPCSLPVLSLIYPSVNYARYPLFLILYIVGFCLAASILYWMAFGINALCVKIHHPHQKKLVSA